MHPEKHTVLASQTETEGFLANLLQLPSRGKAVYSQTATYIWCMQDVERVCKIRLHHNTVSGQWL